MCVTHLVHHDARPAVKTEVLIFVFQPAKITERFLLDLPAHAACYSDCVVPSWWAIITPSLYTAPTSAP